MSTTVDRLDLEAIRERRARTAHFGTDWSHDGTGDGWTVSYGTDHPQAGHLATVVDYAEPVADLIVHAPRDIDALVAEVERLRARVAAVRSLVERVEGNAPWWQQSFSTPEWIAAIRQVLGEAKRHPDDERCYFCATDAEMEAAVERRPHPTIHMQVPGNACPNT